MGKLKKLVRNPRQFVLDSKAYRRFALFQHKALSRPHHFREAPRLDRSYSDSLGELLSAFAASVPVLDVTDSPVPTLAVLLKDVHFLSRHLHELVRDNHYTIRLSSSKGESSLANRSLIGVDDAIAGKSTFTIKMLQKENPDHLFMIDVQVWQGDERQVVGPARNRIARRISSKTVQSHGLFRRGELRSLRSILPYRLPTEPSFPIDVVYTWVNHEDPGWQAMYTAATGVTPANAARDSESLDRFKSRDELRYSLRSIAEFAPWVRRVFVLTNCAPPPWVDLDSGTLEWVRHEAAIPAECLPTFSSHAIESCLHHIEELSEHFIYMNDDVFLTRPARPDAFFFGASGISQSMMEPYGTVNGDVDSADPDYLNAARNGKRLIEEYFGISPTALHKHAPHVLRKSVMFEMEERFCDAVRATVARPFRTKDDVSFVSFLYHHYASATGAGVYVGRDASLVKPSSRRYEATLRKLLKGRRAPFSLCLNDGGGSAAHPNWDAHVTEFLEGYFSRKCKYER